MKDARHRVIQVVGLALGDCGKGSIVDFLVRRMGVRTVVRFNGGPQAGHNVVTRDGRHHTFSQFGSGGLVPGVSTLLSRFMLVEPYALLNEADHLAEVGPGDPLDRLFIDRCCPVITPAQQAANRLRELVRGSAAHGSCGLGVGETMSDLLGDPASVLHAEDLTDRPTVLRQLRAAFDRKADELREPLADLRGHPAAALAVQTLTDPDWLATAADLYEELAGRATLIDPQAVTRMLSGDGTVLFEGAQGVLLDETFGFHPHTTWSTTTFANADFLLDEAGSDCERVRVGVLRTYQTRHGAGPLVTEQEGLADHFPEPHNLDEGWQGRFRVGLLDAVALRYALSAAGGVDMLAVTHLDRLNALPPAICGRYRLADPTAGRQWFVPDGDLVCDIRPRRVRPTEMEELTRLLGDCRPVPSEVDTPGRQGFLGAIEQALGFPIGIVSAGPTAEDKQMLKSPGGWRFFPVASRWAGG